MTQHKIDKILKYLNLSVKCLPICIFYFILNFGGQIMGPFMTLQARSIGLSMSDITLVYGILSIIAFPSNPGSGYIADKLGYRKVVGISVVLVSASTMLFNFLPPYSEYYTTRAGIISGSDGEVTIKWVSQYTDSDQCDQTTIFSISDLECGEEDEEYAVNKTFPVLHSNITLGVCQSIQTNFCYYENENLLENITTSVCNIVNYPMESHGSHQLLFWLFLLLKTVMIYSINSAYNTGDAISSNIATLENAKYSSILVFSIPGQALASLISGPILDNLTVKEYDCITGEQSEKVNYLIAFIISASCMLASIGAIFFVPQIVRKQEEKKSLKQEFNWVLNPAVIGFYFLQFMNGLVYGASNAYGAVFASEDLGASLTLIGQITTVGIVSNFLVTMGAGKLQAKIGNINLILISLLGRCIQIFLWSVTWSSPPYEFLGYEVLSQSNIMLVGTVGYAAEIAPANLQGTAIGLAATANWIVGKGVGSVLAGYIDGQVGRRWMFTIFAIMLGAVSIIYMILYHTCIKYTEISRKEERVESAEKADSDQSLENLEKEGDSENKDKDGTETSSEAEHDNLAFTTL